VSGDPRVSIVIPTSNGRDMLTRCLEALGRQRFTEFETIVVDNGSTDGTCAMLRADHPDVRVVEMKRNAGFPKAVNAGIHAGRGEFLGILNNDAEPAPGWLATLVARADAEPGEDSWASVLLSAGDESIVESAGVSIRRDGTSVRLWSGKPASSLPAGPVEVLGACGGAALYRRSLLEDIGLFDGSFFLYGEDVDISLRARFAGHRCALVPGARAVHRHMGTARRLRGLVAYYQHRNNVLFLVKNMPLWWLAVRLPRFGFSGLGPLVRRPWRSEGWMHIIAKLLLPMHLPVAILKRVRSRRLRRVRLRDIAHTIVSSRPPDTAPAAAGG
jgi:GT2 family glycosyltransferase